MNRKTQNTERKKGGKKTMQQYNKTHNQVNNTFIINPDIW